MKKINISYVALIDFMAILFGIIELNDAFSYSVMESARLEAFLKGGICLLISVPLTAYLIWDVKRVKRLKKIGYYVNAEFCYLERREGSETNCVCYTIILRYRDPESNEIYRFKAEIQLYYDPTPVLESKGLPVYIDKYDPSNYYVDLTELHNLESELR